MIVRCRLFAAARDQAGNEVVELELPDSSTIGDLRARLAAQYPGLAPLVPHLMFAIDSAYAADDTAIPRRAEIAGIPPVSGG
ncbi:MAG TPA: MoaD/ThiS family protein [Pirellulales bacterium]|nr:MoaD/ThiS family protein [Pirellulales bacterium]